MPITPFTMLRVFRNKRTANITIKLVFVVVELY